MSSRRISALFNQQKSKASALGVRKGGVSKKENLPTRRGAATQRDEDAHIEDRVSEQREVILRKFDLATKFGPCIGMTRLERWERAEELGLNPPADVRSILEGVIAVSGEGKEDVPENHCLWKDRI